MSLSTVLRCVDTRADKEGSFDAAVGQRSATVHEVTEGTSFQGKTQRRVKRLHAIMLHLCGYRGHNIVTLRCFWEKRQGGVLDAGLREKV